MDRRRFLRGTVIGSAALAGAPALVALSDRPAAASLITGPGAVGMTDMGVGMYNDMSTAQQMSTFTIQRPLVTCGVGTFGALGMSGPFAMLMYSVNVQTYVANRATRTLTATGRMRSITAIAGQTIENVEHDFIAIAVDNRGVGPDRFDVHFTTAFWSPPNPLATASTVRPGWSRFGGNVTRDLLGTQMGGVTVSDP